MQRCENSELNLLKQCIFEDFSGLVFTQMHRIGVRDGRVIVRWCDMRERAGNQSRECGNETEDDHPDIMI